MSPDRHPAHPLQLRWRAEDLVRRRRSDEQRRYAAPQRSGQIDANPHQIEAVIFALSRLGEGGCILADEVGLGKTIEAGLVIAQLRAEGSRRILLITPKSLLGQWRQELFTLFGISAQDGAGEVGLGGEGVFLLGREAAGSAHGQRELLAAPPFDLVVMDEAHEVFSGLYKRFDPEGGLRGDTQVAQTATRVFEYVQASGAPVLLLTATPIQNTLTELWALVRFVDPTGTLLGDLRTFRETFCGPDDRFLREGQSEELRRRVGVVLRRTLRRQAQEFLSRPFVGRHAILYEYPLDPAEHALHDEVTAYILSPRLAAFRGSRRLLVIAFQRRLASSPMALAASLESVAERLERLVERSTSEAELRAAFLAELDEDDLAELPEDEATAEDAPLSPDDVRAELATVRGFIARARAIGLGAKARALLEAARLVVDRGREGRGSGKMVIFTDSLVTQDNLRELLVASGLFQPRDVTLFRGQNDSPRAREALARWQSEVGDRLPPHARPARDVAVRLALVHEFETRSRVLISTEAGAKGLNLQFCETVINYDLPWNPQRIEQRIGRCHRYGQKQDVTVVNFIAQGNETEQLVFEILSQKLELFGTVLDASSAVLHTATVDPGAALSGAVGTDLAAQIGRAWHSARTLEEVTADLRALRDRIGEERERFEAEQARTAGLIKSYFDEPVRRVFAQRRAELPQALAELDRDLELLVRGHLLREGTPHQVAVEGGARVLRTAELAVALGSSAEHESLHLSHPLTLSAVEGARRARIAGPIAATVPPDAPAELLDRRGGAARWVGVLARHQGMESVDRLLAVLLFEGEAEPVPPGLAELLLDYPLRDLGEPLEVAVADDAVEDAIDALMFDERQRLSEEEAPRFQRSLEQVERFVEDKLFLLRKRAAELTARLEEARGQRDAALVLDRRAAAEEAMRRHTTELERLDTDIARLGKRDDEVYQRVKARLNQRRHAPSRIEKLFDVAVVLE